MRTSLLTTTRVDLTVALRRLRRDKGFAASAILVLAVGIGANVAVYSTTFNLLVQPLPFVDSERLVIGHVTRDGSRSGGGFISGPDFRDYRDRNTTFESLGALLPFPQHHTLTGADEPDRVEGTVVSVNLFSTLGVGPQLGRGFAEEEGREGGPSVALISDGLWQRRFGGDTSTVGRTLLIDGEPFTVIGVMPAGFRFLAEAEFWRPMRPDRDASDLRERHNWYAVGRLAAGVTLERAQAEVDAISGQLVEEYPETNAGKGMVLTNLQEDLVKDYRSRLFLLSAAVGVVLLIACGNLTGMLLARAPERRTELSVRAALGASKARLVRQMLCEAVVLGTGGGVVGVATAIWMQRVILDYLKVDLPGVDAAQISWPLTGLALAFSLGAGLVAGVYPALAGARGELAEDLKEGCRTNLGGGTRFRGGLVVAQVALSVMVLIGSGLLLKSFTAVRTTDPGFDSGNLLTAEIGLPPAEYSDRGLRTQFFLRLMEEVRRSPGVVSVGLINSLPVIGMTYGFEAFSTDEPDEGKEVCLRSVLPGYFEPMGIPRISGRGLDNEIEPATPPVAVVNRAAARAFFDVENPIGRRLQVDIFGNRQEAEIVGIVEDVRMEGLESAPDPALYLPYQQFPSLTMQVAIRTAGEPALAAAGLRGAVWALDSDVPVADLATMEEVLTGSISERRTIAFSFTLFAALWPWAPTEASSGAWSSGAESR
jgi:putative ABC transport system permease protein